MPAATVFADAGAARGRGLRISDERLGVLLLLLALTAGAVSRLWIAVHDDGIYWPDELFQSLEPAHVLVFGYGYTPWEYEDGARSWFFPGLLAGVLNFCQLVGLDRPEQYLGVFRALFCGLGVLTAVGCWRLARVLGASAPAAAAGAAIFALSGPMIYLAPRALSETASAAPIVFAFALALREGAGRRAMVLAASLLGVAVLIRLQNGVFCLGLLALLAGRRRWSDFRDALAVLILWAAAFGLLDWVTWGRPFHSALVYLQFNLVEGRASDYGTAPATYYLRALVTSMPVLAVALFVLVRLAYTRQPGLAQVGLTAFLLLCCIPHKELRFVAPMLPLFCALAAVGLDAAAERLPSWGGRALATGVCAAGLVSAATVDRLSFSALGQITESRPAGTRALDDGGSIHRLMRIAGRRPDLCGLYIAAPDLAWTGGQVVTHNRAPLFTEADLRPGDFNYAIAPRTPAPAGAVAASDGAMVLVRLKETCAA